MLRPQSTRWIEIVLPHEAFASALDVLAATGRVEIEPAGAHGTHLVSTRALLAGTERFRQLERDHHHFWPEPEPPVSLSLADPLAAMQQALAAVEQWRQEAHELINTLHELDDSRREARLWQAVLLALGEAGVALSDVEVSGSRIDAILCCGEGPTLPAHTGILTLPIDTAMPAQGAASAVSQCHLLVARAGTLDAWRQGGEARCHAWPDWLRGRAEPLEVVETRVETLEAERADAVRRMQRLADRHGLARNLGVLAQCAWVADHLRSLATTRHLIRLTGWAAMSAEALDAELDQAGVTALVVAAEPPRGKAPPLMLRHRRWVRPFETFVRALGMPAGQDADPTVILAVAVPLLFGYMFGDVGHGLVFLLLGLALMRRWPLARVLVWAGASAMVFGLLYGSVFTNETLIPALWLHPLNHPVTLLAGSLSIGVGLLGLGLVLNALQAWWDRENRPFGWLVEGGFIAVYAGIVGAPFFLPALWLAGAGLLGMQLAAGLGGGGRAMLHLTGELIERLFQLLINTLSFVRVGAFALAHAGLASAVTSLAEASTLVGVTALVLLLGNLLILALEGLVVSIQTTRLILFEFFVRFLKGGGRLFKPIQPPPHYQGVQRESS
ncbi:MAG TPA: hypothetical protein ENN42_01130 [Thioalkalivibrio sp.]|nr:hypothetical protein [Thioalkalivibrio sp.]